jgi:hypothetical protein
MALLCTKSAVIILWATVYRGGPKAAAPLKTV